MNKFAIKIAFNLGDFKNLSLKISKDEAICFSFHLLNRLHNIHIREAKRRYIQGNWKRCRVRAELKVKYAAFGK